MRLRDLSIATKLVLVFASMLVTIGAGGLALYFNNTALSASIARTNRAQAVLSSAEDAAFRLARQENSLRGLLLSGDDYYVRRIKEAHQVKFLAALEALQRLAAGDPQALQRLEAVKRAYANYEAVALNAGMALGSDPATRSQGVLLVSHDGVADKAIEPVEDAIGAINEAAARTLEQEAAEQARALARVKVGVIAGILALAGLSLAAGLILARSIADPVRAMTGVMRKLAAGDNAVDVPASTRGDEVGAMGQAVLSFREGALARIRLQQEADAAQAQAARQRAEVEAERVAAATEQTKVVEALANGLSRLSTGDLTCRIGADFSGGYEALRTDFNAAVGKLEGAMGRIVQEARGISAGSQEVNQAADDLSRRTEAQAATLEETAAALQELTNGVRTTAQAAQQADEVAAEARLNARTSHDVVQRAVTAMDEIAASSRQIDKIIGVIDEIAFQTNLLALNAGVEAARAGQAGQGFAVVAQEVRALAQRSAEAAKEIKDLVGASHDHVKAGVELVGQTGEALQETLGRFERIAALVTRIAASAKEQSAGLGQINTAVNQMDQVTQQNAGMVEETTAATQTLSRQAKSLTELVGAFRVEGRPAQVAARRAG